MTFDRNKSSTDYLAISRMIRDLQLHRHSYDSGTLVRIRIEEAIESLESVKAVLGAAIDNNFV